MKPLPVPDSALLTGATRLLAARLKRDALFMAVLCLTIALLLTAIDPGGFAAKLVYSFSIGICCWLLTNGTRTVTLWLVDRARIARGLPAAAAGAIGLRAMLPLVLLSIIIGPPVGLWIADSITGYSSPSLLQFDSNATRLTLAITVIAPVLMSAS